MSGKGITIGIIAGITIGIIFNNIVFGVTLGIIAGSILEIVFFDRKEETNDVDCEREKLPPQD